MNKKLSSLLLMILTSISWGCGSGMNGWRKQLKMADDTSQMSDDIETSKELRSSLQLVEMEDEEGDEFAGYIEEDDEHILESAIDQLVKEDSNFETFYSILEGTNKGLKEPTIVRRRKAWGGGRAGSAFAKTVKTPLQQTLVRLSTNCAYKDDSSLTNVALTPEEEDLRSQLFIGKELAEVESQQNRSQRIAIRSAQRKKMFLVIDAFIKKTCADPMQELKSIMPVLCSFWQVVGAIKEESKKGGNKVPIGYKNITTFDKEAKALHNFHYAAVELLKGYTCNCADSLKSLYDEYKEEVE